MTRRRAPPSGSFGSTAEVLSLLQKAERVGADASEILSRAQVPYALSDLAADRPPQIARKHLVAIYRECIVSIGRHSSRLDRKPQMHPDEFRLMCHCVITARTLRAVIERQSMFFRTRDERISTISLEVGADRATVAVDTLRRRKSFAAFLSDLAGMSMFCRLYAWLIGLGEHPFRVGLAHGRHFAKEAITEFFAGSLTFDEPVNSISFAPHLLSMPVIRTPEELEQLLLEFPFDFISARPAALRLSDRLRNIYDVAIARGESLPGIAALAEQTGLSLSTLRRKLMAEGSSIRALKDAARHDAAVEMLRHGRRKIDEVAFQLGFRDTDCFRASFRRWTGSTPSSVRTQT
jgi:AraC-like DNA-binding protein